MQNIECTEEIITNAIDDMVSTNNTIFREILSNIPERQKELLYAIAKESEAESITSADFIKRHRLPSASSVQAAVKTLMDKGLITKKRQHLLSQRPPNDNVDKSHIWDTLTKTYK